MEGHRPPRHNVTQEVSKMYSYKFLENGDIDIRTNGDTSDGFITFPNDPIVDWTKRRYSNGVLEDMPQTEPPAPYVPTAEETKQQNIAVINATYMPQINIIKENIINAEVVMKNLTLAGKYRDMLTQVKSEYQQKLGSV